MPKEMKCRHTMSAKTRRIAAKRCCAKRDVECAATARHSDDNIIRVLDARAPDYRVCAIERTMPQQPLSIALERAHTPPLPPELRRERGKTSRFSAGRAVRAAQTSH